MGVKNADLVDLIETTLPDLPNQNFEVTWTNQNYEACRIYQQDRMEIDGGTSIKRKLMLNPTGNARYRRLFDTDEPAVGDVMYEIDVPWTQIGTHYSWDKVEILRNKNSAKGFIRLLETRRIEGLWSLADLIEDRFWKAPDSVTDDLNPYGVPYYLNMLDDDATAAGFLGQTIRYEGGTTGTVCAGLDANVETKWKNYAGTYTKVDNSLLRTFRQAFILTKFKAPMILNDPSTPYNASKRIYSDSDMAIDLQDLADAKDDNHSGKDVLGNLRMDDGGLVYINRLPVVYISQLDGVTDPVQSSATSPLYCVDFTKFIPYVQDGFWMEESEPMTDRGQHTTFTIFLDGSHNNLCINRRTAGFVIHKPITS
ncbi:hypothetical protein LCGC14_1311610 [marine sediment metagenome]|uniref:Major capsid protein n=1 Tax=marine sediment metagenome TaxID=412755 RepID=A0A0F9L766_9ZZZZ